MNYMLEKKNYTWKSLEISAGIIIPFFKGSCNNKVVKIIEAYNSSMRSTTTIKKPCCFLLVTTYTIKCIQLFKPIAFN